MGNKNIIDTSLMRVAKDGNLDEVKRSLENGADINVEDLYSDTPLLLAARNDHWDVVKFLVKYRARGVKDMKTDKEFQEFINKGDRIGDPLIAYAAREGNVDAVKFLFEYGVSANARDGQYNTPIINAAENGHEELVKFLLLLQHSMDVLISTKNTKGESALSLAKKNNHPNIVALLIAHGARL